FTSRCTRPARAVDLVGQVAEALDAAHRAGLVHRDVKPSNVITLPNGFAYLIDFGIARGVGQATITSAGVAVGTWAYMAPERFSGTEDLRSDVYSLACLLYEILTGAKPFAHTDPVQQMAAHLTADPPRASDHSSLVPAALDSVIARGMAKDPAHRYPSAGALAAAARAALDSGPPAPADAKNRTAPTAKWDGGEPLPGYRSPHPASTPTPTPRPVFSSDHRDSGASTPPPGRLPVGATPPPGRRLPGATPPPFPLPGVPHGSGAVSLPSGTSSGGMPGGATSSAGAVPSGVFGAGAYGSPYAGQPAGFVPAGTPGSVRDRPRVSAWRVLWWILLPLLILFFGLFTAAGIDVVLTEKADGAAAAIGTAIALMIFAVPLGLFIWLAVREVRKFRGAGRR
ncbi:protein kinase, partial [Nocardia sp. JMUB6875]|uniref:protein kinase domain-containing protein n=1 Tax=Nocardia sp. JMUB6875 TaxID=3158170 RepID=UPI0034E84A2B